MTRGSVRLSVVRVGVRRPVGQDVARAGVPEMGVHGDPKIQDLSAVVRHLSARFAFGETPVRVAFESR